MNWLCVCEHHLIDNDKMWQSVCFHISMGLVCIVCTSRSIGILSSNKKNIQSTCTTYMQTKNNSFRDLNAKLDIQFYPFSVFSSVFRFQCWYDAHHYETFRSFYLIFFHSFIFCIWLYVIQFGRMAVTQCTNLGINMCL